MLGIFKRKSMASFEEENAPSSPILPSSSSSSSSSQNEKEEEKVENETIITCPSHQDYQAVAITLHNKGAYIVDIRYPKLNPSITDNNNNNNEYKTSSCIFVFDSIGSQVDTIPIPMGFGFSKTIAPHAVCGQSSKGGAAFSRNLNCRVEITTSTQTIVGKLLDYDWEKIFLEMETENSTKEYIWIKKTHIVSMLMPSLSEYGKCTFQAQVPQDLMAQIKSEKIEERPRFTILYSVPEQAISHAITNLIEILEGGNIRSRTFCSVTNNSDMSFHKTRFYLSEFGTDPVHSVREFNDNNAYQFCLNNRGVIKSQENFECDNVDSKTTGFLQVMRRIKWPQQHEIPKGIVTVIYNGVLMSTHKNKQNFSSEIKFEDNFELRVSRSWSIDSDSYPARIDVVYSVFNISTTQSHEFVIVENLKPLQCYASGFVSRHTIPPFDRKSDGPFLIHFSILQK